MKIDHVTIRTCQLAATRDFFLWLFDLHERSRPRALAHIPGHWLYTGDNPIIHLMGIGGERESNAKEAWDHVGFRLSGYEGFRYKLDRLAIAYSVVELSELAEKRLFFRTPGGTLVETVFSAAIHPKEKDNVI